MQFLEQHSSGPIPKACSRKIQVSIESYLVFLRLNVTFPVSAAFCAGDALGSNSWTVPPAFLVSSTILLSSLFICIGSGIGSDILEFEAIYGRVKLGGKTELEGNG
jgi:hypothetical protein